MALAIAAAGVLAAVLIATGVFAPKRAHDHISPGDEGGIPEQPRNEAKHPIDGIKSPPAISCNPL